MEDEDLSLSYWLKCFAGTRGHLGYIRWWHGNGWWTGWVIMDGFFLRVGFSLVLRLISDRELHARGDSSTGHWGSCSSVDLGSGRAFKLSMEFSGNLSWTIEIRFAFLNWCHHTVFFFFTWRDSSGDDVCNALIMVRVMRKSINFMSLLCSVSNQFSQGIQRKST